MSIKTVTGQLDRSVSEYRFLRTIHSSLSYGSACLGVILMNAARMKSEPVTVGKAVWGRRGTPT
jgi:hypothetical protein